MCLADKTENATAGKYDRHPHLSRAHAGMRAISIKGILFYYTSHFAPFRPTTRFFNPT